MSREIKFRAWYKKSQTWVYFNLNEGFYESGLEIYRDLVLAGASFYQFTGLNDTHGQEIYEGDILQHNTNRFIVEFFKEHGFILFVMDNRKNWRGMDWCDNVRKYIEVIGNIHENPERL